MNTLSRTFFLYTCLLCMFLGISEINAQEHTDFYTINGTVKDKNTRKNLEYVHISIPGTNIGTVTNQDGEFSLKIKHSLHKRTIEISHIGYFNYRQPVNSKDTAAIILYLVPRETLLNEIIIHAPDAKLIVEEAMNRIGNNYADKPTLLTGFYRETAKKGRKYITVSEAILHTYKTTYKEDASRDRVQIQKGRKLLSQKKNDTLAVKLLGGPNLSVFVDIVKNPDFLLDKESLSYFTYKMEEPTTIDNRPQYVIRFTPQVLLPYALYSGTLYIDKANLAFSRAEFSLDMADKTKATEMILKKKPAGLRFQPVQVSFLVTYRQHDQKSYLSYMRNEVKFKCDWKRKLFSTQYTIVSETVITETQEKNIQAIPYKTAFRPTQALSDNVMDFFDENFWEDYNIIEPTESLESAVGKLKKQYRKEAR